MVNIWLIVIRFTLKEVKLLVTFEISRLSSLFEGRCLTFSHGRIVLDCVGFCSFVLHKLHWMFFYSLNCVKQLWHCLNYQFTYLKFKCFPTLLMFYVELCRLQIKKTQRIDTTLNLLNKSHFLNQQPLILSSHPQRVLSQELLIKSPIWN